MEAPLHSTINNAAAVATSHALFARHLVAWLNLVISSCCEQKKILELTIKNRKSGPHRSRKKSGGKRERQGEKPD